jgi:hypothetical protein
MQKAEYAPMSLRAPGAGARLALPLFTLTLFLSAFLIFVVELMSAKPLLPKLGGAPAVWNTCLVFFQATLLAGYAYALCIAAWLPARGQVLVHSIALMLGALFLPFGLAGLPAPPSDQWPVWWLLSTLTVTIGPPFLILSAMAPLLQRWFAYTGHRSANDPYFLYVASNVGSMFALLSYPLLIEPSLPLARLNILWAYGYGMLALLVLACGGLIWSAQKRPAGAGQMAETPRLHWGQRLHWLALAFVPSSLLLGVTSFITTDLAAVPLIWVIPLALYLLTFIIAFSSRPVLQPGLMAKVQVFLLIAVGAAMPFKTGLFGLALNLGCFFATAMVCHGQLARLRPAVPSLTEFYLWVALGGMLGGLFNALMAPLIFPYVYEYGLMLAAGTLLWPKDRQADGRLTVRGHLLLPAVLLMWTFAVWLANHPRGILVGPLSTGLLLVVLVPTALVLLRSSSRPLRFSLGIAVFLLIPSILHPGILLRQDRSFFGVYRILSVGADRLTVLMNGVIMHGAAVSDPARRLEPITYYGREGPVGQFFTAFRGGTRKVGVIGLGAGVITCYARPEDTWTFYEIDPLVEELARDERFFHFLAECGHNVTVSIGDGRLSIERADDRGYDVVILEGFTSDSIPVHLLTREALALYLRKLGPGGAIMLHISNRYLDLLPVVAALAVNAGAVGRYQLFAPDPGSAARTLEVASIWAVVARTEADLSFLDGNGKWRRLEEIRPGPLWTDDYSSLIGAIRWRR